MVHYAHAVVGVLFSLAASIILLLCCLSTPVTKSLYFFHGEYPGSNGQPLVHVYGIWGKCFRSYVTEWCSPAGLSRDDLYLPPGAPFWLHYLHVLYPIGTAFSFFAFFSSIPSLFSRSRNLTFPTGFYLGFILPAAVAATIAFVVARVEFGFAYSHYHDRPTRIRGEVIKYGPGLWMSLVAAIILIIAAVHAFWGVVARTRERRQAYARAIPPGGMAQPHMYPAARHPTAVWTPPAGYQSPPQVHKDPAYY